MAQSNSVYQEQSLGFRVWRGAINHMHHAHQHNDLEINMLLSGQVTYIHGGRLFDLHEGHMTLFWAAIPHLIVRQSPQARMAWMTLPLDWLWQCDCASGLLTNLLSGQMVSDIQPEEQDDPAMKRWHEYRSHADAQWHLIASLEVEARFRRFLISNQSWESPSHRNKRRKQEKTAFDPVQKMADYLSGHFRKPIGVEDVARQVKLHPNYAMRLFRKHLNMTMIQYLTQQRVAEARRLLLTTDMPILEIVYECGFGSTSQFYQAFENYVGQSPRKFRKQLAAESE
jgi:AraC-like DNA-binding protein